MTDMKRTTMKDIADALGVSINAVSLALNNKAGVSQELRSRIFDTAERLGYFANKPKYKQVVQQRTICLIMRKMYFAASNFYSQVILGVQEEAANQGYSILIEVIEESGQHDIPECIRKQLVSAAILLGAIPDDYLTSLIETGIKLILVDNLSYMHDVDSIMTSNNDGTYRLTNHLISRNYRTFGFFGDLDYSFSVRERHAGVVQALYDRSGQQTHTQIYNELERYSVLYGCEDLVIQEDRVKIRQALQKLPELPEVLICSNDDAAAQVILTLHAMGVKVPEEIAVTGFDNSSIATRTLPALTTLHVEKKVLGKEAVRRLIWRTYNPNGLATRTSIRTELIVRGSTR